MARCSAPPNHGWRDLPLQERACLERGLTLRARTLDRVFDDVSLRVSDQTEIVLRGAAVSVLSDQLGIS